MMTKRLASLILVLSLSGTVFAGIPSHSGGGDPGMMDCCKKALEHNDSPSVAAARLCCAMNCDDPGSTSGNTSQNFSQTGSEPTPLIFAVPPENSPNDQLRVRYHRLIAGSPKPAYIINLALLI